jgi:hypothetical protein
MKTDQGLLNHPDEDSQVAERIWSILEVMPRFPLLTCYKVRGIRYNAYGA